MCDSGLQIEDFSETDLQFVTRQSLSQWKKMSSSEQSEILN
jgi:hypothetical protein